MNILLSPDSFKGTLTSSEVCDIIESALRNRIPDCNVIKLPAADGGEGLCSSFANFIDGEWISAESKDPFGLSLRAEYYMLKSGAAVIETASCAGLPLAGDRTDPTVTTTAGVGMLIRDAVNRGAKRIVLGLGGSATNDCGAGMASELDFRFLDKNNNSFVPVGGTLIDVEHIIPPEKPVDIPVVAACDVTNPLFGVDGAAYVFAPQKGANAEQVGLLDRGLHHMADILKRDLNFNSENLPGAGAAGNAALSHHRRIIALLVDLCAFAQDPFRAELDAIATLFAAVKINLYQIHNQPPFFLSACVLFSPFVLLFGTLYFYLELIYDDCIIRFPLCQYGVPKFVKFFSESPSLRYSKKSSPQ